MDRYIGIDAHLGSCTVAVLDGRGRKLGSHLVETNGAALQSCIRQIPGRRHICIEEGGFSEWIFELLEPLAERIVVVQPPAARGTKNDALDAWARADELRRGNIATSVFKAPHVYTELRLATRTYLAIREDLKRAKHRLKASFRSCAIRAGEGVYDPSKRRELLARRAYTATRSIGWSTCTTMLETGCSKSFAESPTPSVCCPSRGWQRFEPRRY